MLTRVRPRLAIAAFAVGEVAAFVIAPVPSPTATLASVLVSATPGPLATWVLDTFRSAARPLTVVFAGGLLLGALALVSALVPRREVPVPDSSVVPPVPPVMSRRALLTGLGVGGSALVGLALLARPRRSTLQVALPSTMRPDRSLPPLTSTQDVAPTIPGLSPTLTPVQDFFRIDTAISLPRVTRDEWRLRVHGRVDEPMVLTFDELVALGVEEHDVTIACVSNEVGGELVGTARWTGVPLSRVLAEARPTDDAEQVVGRSVDGWTGGFPLEFAGQPDALVAIGMNGVELPVRHGYPARLIVPQLFGYVSATKWLTDIELTGWDDYDAYWIRRGWAKRGPLLPSARIDVPGRSAQPGLVRVAGVAWAPPAGVAAVEVRIDRGVWRTATCSDPLGPMVWRQWWLDVELPAGRHELRARVRDAAGRVQPEGPRPVLPSGAEGWHTRLIDVRSA